MDEMNGRPGGRTRKINVLGREFSMPQSRPWRVVIGVLLVILGCFGFLPVLGFWMIPLGLLILSYEFALVRRWRRRTELWWGERRGRRRRRFVARELAKGRRRTSG
jgi:purine-cytosine permease-like protein